ncbi:MAG TPA: hypothetical protein VGH74_21465 [Planctomycetaceae bacterium]|jgi:hypothetical protein
MAIELVCSCGRLVRFDKPPVDGEGRCPDCNAVLTIDSDRSIKATIADMPVDDQAPVAPTAGPLGAARKPLWELMARNQNLPEFGEAPGQMQGEPPVEPPAEPPGAVTIEADYDSEPPQPATGTAGPVGGRKGLWSVMQTPAMAGANAKHNQTSADENPGAGTDLNKIGPPGSPGRNPKSEIPVSKTTGPKSNFVAPVATSNSDSPPDSLASMIGIAPDEGVLSAQSKAAGFHAKSSRRAVTAAALGILSIPLSGLALINAGWSRLPATALGFVAILTGLIASQEIQRSGGRKTGRRQAITGIITGIIGAFLGPLVIAPLARPRKGRHADRTAEVPADTDEP